MSYVSRYQLLIKAMFEAVEKRDVNRLVHFYPYPYSSGQPKLLHRCSQCKPLCKEQIQIASFTNTRLLTG